MACNCTNSNIVNNCCTTCSSTCTEPYASSCYGAFCDDRLSSIDKVSHGKIIVAEYPTGSCFLTLDDTSAGFIGADASGGFKVENKISETHFTFSEPLNYLTDGNGNIQTDGVTGDPIRLVPPQWDYMLGLDSSGCVFKFRGSSSADGVILWDNDLGKFKVGSLYDNGIQTTATINTLSQIKLAGFECDDDCDCNPNDPVAIHTLQIASEDVIKVDANGCASAVDCANPAAEQPDTVVGCKDGLIKHFAIADVVPEVVHPTLCEQLNGNTSVRFVQPVYNKPVLLNIQNQTDNMTGTFDLDASLTVPAAATGVKLQVFVAPTSLSTGKPADITVELDSKFTCRSIAEEQRDDVSSTATDVTMAEIWIDLTAITGNNVPYDISYNDYSGAVTTADIQYSVRVFAQEWAIDPCAL